jgi:hypothetical protein
MGGCGGRSPQLEQAPWLGAASLVMVADGERML